MHQTNFCLLQSFIRTPLSHRPGPHARSAKLGSITSIAWTAVPNHTATRCLFLLRYAQSPYLAFAIIQFSPNI